MPDQPTSPETATPAESVDAANAWVDLIAAALRGDAVDPARLNGKKEIGAFLRAVDVHRVGPLLHQAMSADGGGSKWPEEIRERLSREASEAKAKEAIQVEEIRRVLAGLDAEGLTALVIKGTAHAYSLYPRPHARPRAAIDLLVRKASVVDAVRILDELGYRRHDPLPGQRVLGQDSYLRDDERGNTQALNLHWGVSNRTPQNDMVDYAELRQRAVDVDALSPCALGLCREDALLQACLNRAGENDKENLLGLYDIHLLVGGMTPVEFSRFAATALQKRAGIAARNAIEAANSRFHTALPSGTLETHFPEANLAEEARFARGVTPARHRINLLLSDLRKLGLRSRTLASKFGRAFPTSAQKRDRDGAENPGWLPAHYLRRGLEGVTALLRRSN